MQSNLRIGIQISHLRISVFWLGMRINESANQVKSRNHRRAEIFLNKWSENTEWRKGEKITPNSEGPKLDFTDAR